MDPRAGMDDMKKWKSFTLPGPELRPILSRLGRSQSLYRLCYGASLHLLSRPSSGVTYKDGILDWTLGLFDTHCLQYVITIHSGAIASSHSLHSLHARWVHSHCCSTPFLWYRFPTTGIPFPGHGDLQRVPHLLELPPLVQICIV
jgi:hypothetical protein